MCSLLDSVGPLLRQLVLFGIAASADKELLVLPTIHIVPIAMQNGVLGVQSKVEHVHEDNEAKIEGSVVSHQSTRTLEVGQLDETPGQCGQSILVGS